MPFEPIAASELDRADGHVDGGDVGGRDVGAGVLVDERDRPAQRVGVVSGRGSPSETIFGARTRTTYQR